ncbi:g6902 [Coccomyxa elongata]
MHAPTARPTERLGGPHPQPPLDGRGLWGVGVASHAPLHEMRGVGGVGGAEPPHAPTRSAIRRTPVRPTPTQSPPLDGLASQVFGVPSDGWPTNPNCPIPSNPKAFRRTGV